MEKFIGIRREDKNIWEKRVPLIPEHIKSLHDNHKIKTIIQPFPERAFSDQEFIDAGASVDEIIDQAPVIFAVKEIPTELLKEEKTYIYFSHTIKGQDYNMPMLQKLLDLKCTLIDYECIANESGRRLVFFGKYAGLAGMIDGLHGFGLRLKALGYDTPLLKIKSAYEYKDVVEAIDEIAKVGEEIASEGLPEKFAPYVFGFAGYGNVSNGAQEVFAALPYEEITPDELLTLKNTNTRKFYKVIFKENDLVEPVESSNKFELQDYYDNPHKYKSKFEKYLKYVTLLVNAVYWDERYPRIVTKEFVKQNIDDLKLLVIADISCDIDGGIEFTVKATESDNPAFVYNPSTDEITDGYEGEGVVDISVDNLPTELPRNSSIEFSKSLMPFVPGIVNADLSLTFEKVNYPEQIKRAVIVYKGELTPNYKHLKEYLDQLK
ncbi:MAG: hypothetical protein K9J16_07490 [Melioribacteraceae bacterium]|nr:hypothetical protein [Melioribacteraceae bacterium]MCF8353436.1 hypothetical protein [Melioribacteraceae bacterium]MCF8393924.1 hypothetical protein [Melioribacteraceae bacterium]MCF8418997.1 hypothetical protein [Melioribacteraceae bacterium]